jgi:hypothetical protein
MIERKCTGILTLASSVNVKAPLSKIPVARAVYERDCAVSILSPDSLSSCSSIQSICVPTSVDCIPQFCFYGCRRLSKATFESGSEIWAFGASHLRVADQFTRFASLLHCHFCASCFRQCPYLSEVAFESDSQLAILSESAFEACSLLGSICLPFALETISKFCFKNCRRLTDFAFERNPKASHLGGCAFAGYSSLQSISLPSGLREVTGFSLGSSAITSLSVSAGGRFLKVSGCLLVHAREVCAIRYFGYFEK